MWFTVVVHVEGYDKITVGGAGDTRRTRPQRVTAGSSLRLVCDGSGDAPATPCTAGSAGGVALMAPGDRAMLAWFVAVAPVGEATVDVRLCLAES